MDISGIGKIQRQRDDVAEQPRMGATELWGPTKVMWSIFRGDYLAGVLQIKNKWEITIPGDGEKCLKVHEKSQVPW